MTLPLTKLMGAALLSISTSAAFAAAPVVGVPTQTTPTAPILIAPTMTAPLQVVPRPTQNLIKPKLTSITLTPNVYAPGPGVTLNMNLTGDIKATNCKFVANVHTVVGGDIAISTQVNSSPILVSANLPHTGLNVPLGAIPNQGKYRVDLIAAQLTGQPSTPTDCDGIASAEFELKRQKINNAGVADISGIYVATNGYNKATNSWNVDIKGQTTGACAYKVQFKHETSGKVFEAGQLGSLPTSWAFSNFGPNLPYGDYTVTVKGWNDGYQPQNSVPCLGSVSMKAYRDIPADAIRITSTLMYLKVAGKTFHYSNNASVATSELTDLEISPSFTNPQVGQQGCTYSIKVAKGGQELVIPLKSWLKQPIYPAINQKFGMTAGDYAITVVSTPADYVPGVLSCTGGTTHQLTLTADKPTITAVAASWPTCSGSSCYVNLTTSFSGNGSCTYAVSVQKSGSAATVFPLQIHNPGVPAVLQFNFYNGLVPVPEILRSQLIAEPYFIKAYPAGGAAGCAGEANIGPTYLMK